MQGLQYVSNRVYIYNVFIYIKNASLSNNKTIKRLLKTTIEFHVNRTTEPLPLQKLTSPIYFTRINILNYSFLYANLSVEFYKYCK